MLLGQTFGEENIVRGARKRDVNDSTSVRVADFRFSVAEFPPAKAMRMNRNLRPRGKLVFEFLQLIHE